jgi:hypothetical protein
LERKQEGRVQALEDGQVYPEDQFHLQICGFEWSESVQWEVLDQKRD